ncbi:forkhead box protein P3 [Parambassis ranga]|uniref:Forkhead box protein P3-like n=1 Tax=Parambassis ranga TaxID=210632 RepID=A0A6P7IMJ9_9TELE|nr:forkhead box protein P3-like [Parambassis ranga]XP_028266042.1 forkhead box protein P3-like [Parambassis ranga]
MPETSDESVTCGQHRAQPQSDKIKEPEEPCPPPPPPPPSPLPPQTRDVVSPPASGNQWWSGMEGIKQKQQRPSVLRKVSHTASRRQHALLEDSAAVAICKEEVDADHLSDSSSTHVHSSPGPSHHLVSLRRDDPKQTSTESRFYDRHSEHSQGDRSIAQWRVQQDIVQYMESQLILEKQKLIAMQLHLSEHKYSNLKTASEWPYSLPLLLPQPQETDGDRVQQWGLKALEGLSQHGYGAAGSSHPLPDLVPSIECYKYNNIRPPYTYAYLIRWSILESSDKQRTLNEIYNWFTTMFFYFRHNTATWKNAVRHNLSLHKCFVRVEGGKGAVWTVDEREYQRRKGQKYHRDCSVKWLTSFSHY